MKAGCINVDALVELDYQPQNQEELYLRKGTVITVISKDGDEDWWRGEKDGQVGIFPADCVKLLPTKHEMMQKMKTDKATSNREIN
ncbi:SH3 domain-containing protein, partial [Salmonella sp. s51884]|uniref:SH3 domain-containing protein n=1 Tax=Salmonella sp. s51884 TaxID=3159654 RepID=UPI0039809E51